MKKVLSFPNILSFSRFPLAILIIVSFQSWLRYLFLFLAILTDALDGYGARKLGDTTKLGAILDPLFDKIFVCILFVFVFFARGLTPFALLFFLRDAVTLVGAIVLLTFHRSSVLRVQARLAGKLVTCLQFLCLFFLIQGSLRWFQFSFIFLVAISVVAIADYAMVLCRSCQRARKIHSHRVLY